MSVHLKGVGRGISVRAGIIGVMVSLGCGNGAESGSDSDSLLGDGNSTSCSSTGIGQCRDDEQCVFRGTGSCLDWIGVCEEIPDECTDGWVDWQACLCGNLAFPSACAGRAARRGGPLLLCKPQAAGQECDLSSGVNSCPTDEVCVLRGVDDGIPAGRCVPIEEVCGTAPVESVCETSIGVTGGYGACWDSPCVAWRSGHHGLLALE